jgi:DNA-binding response OmpR family regulator
MPDIDPLDQLQVLLSRLRALEDERHRCVLDIEGVVGRLAGSLGKSRTGRNRSSLAVLHDTFEVRWGDCICRFGPTTPFRLIERLSRRPNIYVTYEQLIDDVWDGQARSETAIRSAVRELRRILREAGMKSVADTIHGQGRCYGLMLDRLREAYK